MLAKKYRLTTQDHKALAKGAQKHYSRFFRVAYQKNNHGITKMSVVVSKKVYKNAYDRNAIRRKLQHILSTTYQQFSQGYNVVISLLRPVDDLKHEQLSKELLASLKVISD